MSKWKPGQLVTIEGKVYRVCHNPDFFVCHKCAFTSSRVCTFAKPLCDKIEKKYIIYSYFKQIYPKRI